MVSSKQFEADLEHAIELIERGNLALHMACADGSLEPDERCEEGQRARSAFMKALGEFNDIPEPGSLLEREARQFWLQEAQNGVSAATSWLLDNGFQ